MTKDVLWIYGPEKRTKLLIAAALMVSLIAAVDWRIEPYISLGFLYLFPIMIIGGFLPRAQIVGVGLLCALLDFSSFPAHETPVHLIFSSAGFVGTGLFVSELVHSRRIVLKHMEEMQAQERLRRDVERQMHMLVESSPAAIVIVESNGTVAVANEAAQKLLAPDGPTLEGQSIESYLPTLQTVIQNEPSRVFRTALQCRGQRSSGEAFLAGIWFSTYTTLSGPRLAAIVVDLSEDLRNREDLSLDHLLKSSRILMSAVSHEVRNLCGAVLVVHKNLSRVRELEHNEDFHALGTLIQSLEKVSALPRNSSPTQNAAAVELTSVLDELRILIDASYQESDMHVEWQVQDALPLVWADRYGLMQVFLNLAKNSQRAMRMTERKRLRVIASADGNKVVVRFEDSGVGISSPENLFRAFQRGADSTGLGLYVSRAIMKSFGGDLIYEPRPQGCCFAIVLPLLTTVKEAANA